MCSQFLAFRKMTREFAVKNPRATGRIQIGLLFHKYDNTAKKKKMYLILLFEDRVGCHACGGVTSCPMWLGNERKK